MPVWAQFVGMIAAMISLLLPLALAGSTLTLRNDTNTSDSYNTADLVAWLAFPECAVSVFTVDPSALPMSVHTVQLYLGSSTGSQDGMATMVEVGLQLLEDDEVPSLRHTEWGFEAFFLDVSSTSLTELCLVNEKAGWSPLRYESGRLAVFVCAPDPATGEAWPSSSASDTSGIIIDAESPSSGSWLHTGTESVTLQSLGASGSWIIRAIANGEPCTGESDPVDVGDDTGFGADTGDGGEEDAQGPLVPALSSVTPSSTYLATSIEAVVLGEGFAPDALVYIGGLPMSALSGQGEVVRSGYTPSALPLGSHDVVVINPDGQTNTLPGGFMILEAEDLSANRMCGCGSSAPAGWWWLLVAPIVLLRRR